MPNILEYLNRLDRPSGAQDQQQRGIRDVSAYVYPSPRAGPSEKPARYIELLVCEDHRHPFNSERCRSDEN